MLVRGGIYFVLVLISIIFRILKQTPRVRADVETAEEFIADIHSHDQQAVREVSNALRSARHREFSQGQDAGGGSTSAQLRVPTPAPPYHASVPRWVFFPSFSFVVRRPLRGVGPGTRIP